MEGLQRFGGGIARELKEQRRLAVNSLGVVYQTHPGGNSGAKFKSISHRCYLREVAFEWELTQDTIYLPLGCLQGGCGSTGVEQCTREGWVQASACARERIFTELMNSDRKLEAPRENSNQVKYTRTAARFDPPPLPPEKNHQPISSANT